MANKTITSFEFAAVFSTIVVLTCCSPKLQATHSDDCDGSAKYEGLTQILEPIRNDGPDILFIFTSGAFIEPERYSSFLETLQATATDLRLWIATLRDSVYLTPELMEVSIDEALSRVQELGFRSNGSRLFLGGHSQGGVVSTMDGYKRALGLVLVGSHFLLDGELIQYPTPALTVIGDRDGQMGYHTAALDTFLVAKIEAEYTEEHTYYSKPVVVIPGMNHAQGYDGENPNWQRGDLVAEIPVEQAHEETAAAIAAFLTIVYEESVGSKKSTTASEWARKTLKAKVSVNREKSLIYGRAMDEQDHGAATMQIRIAAGSAMTADDVRVVRHDFTSYFNFSRPVEIGGRTIIPVYMHPLQRSYNLLFNMWVKFRTRQAILGNSSSKCTEAERCADAVSTARELNAITLEKALQLIPEESRDKYYNEGLQLRFVDDLELDSRESWDESDVVTRPAAADPRSYECQSPVYKTDDVLSMKLITLARAMAWIYEDAFRFHQIF